ncbi:MAG TPA: hypothetical protein VKZ18_29435 [Polyangia bacterium]|nr:hypothetical protein [Polyangia bacterium]
MRTSLLVCVLGIGAAAGAGCGGSSSGSGGGGLTCSYIASDANCWKTTAAAAPSCLPASTEIGTLSADGKTCTYASGDVVTFTPALVLPLPTTGNMNWNFTVTTGSGASCLVYKDDGSGNLTLTVGDGAAAQSVKETTPGGLGISLSCPDGTTYSNSNGLTLLSCPDASFFTALPGAGWSDTSTSVSLTLTGVGGSYGSLPIFDCQTAP